MEKTTHQRALYSVLLTKYHSGDKIKKNEMEHMGDMRGAYRILAEKPDGETPFTQPRRRWNHSIKTDEEIGCGRRVD